MKTPQTQKDLEDLIQNKIEENFSLEYKDGRALERSDKKITEIAKDISAMANSIGGLIIYGISETNNLPEKFSPIDREKFSKEWLENVITSNISPKIYDLKIVPISVDSGVVYVVEIQQGTTAHQNTKDCKYYKRRNFKSEPMLDYEIRDILNRAKHPIVELEFEIEKKITYGIRKDSDGYDYEAIANMELFLKIRPSNKGTNYAQFVNYFIELPIDILTDQESRNLKKPSPDVAEFYGENIIRDSASSRFDPILPKLYGRSEKIQLITNLKFDDREIKWRVHADNAPLQTGSIALRNILIIEKRC